MVQLAGLRFRWFRGPKTLSVNDAVMLNGGRDVAVVHASDYQRTLTQAADTGRKRDGVHVPVVVTLAADLGNKDDPYAIAIQVNRRTVGFLPAPIARAYGPILRRLRDEGKVGQCHATIVGGWDRGHGDRADLTIFLDLAPPAESVPADTEHAWGTPLKPDGATSTPNGVTSRAEDASSDVEASATVPEDDLSKAEASATEAEDAPSTKSEDAVPAR